MPLAFKSENHGEIAFGFFNIESDMLLLENYFFFADQFCRWICTLAGTSDNTDEHSRVYDEVYYIENSDDIGDLMGAIHGIRLTGFIGDLYRIFPFPSDPAAFKQNPAGFKTRDIVRSLIEKYAGRTSIKAAIDSRAAKAFIGPYAFTRKFFHELVKYVWNGGYPAWLAGQRPGYVIEMKRNVQTGLNPFFTGVF